MKKLFAFTCCIFTAFALFGNSNKGIQLSSPNGKIHVSISLADTLSYTIKHDEKTILHPSIIALELSDGSMMGKNPTLIRSYHSKHAETIVSPLYRFASFQVEYNQLECRFKDDFSVIFRAYNEGIAYRLVTLKKGEIVVKNEIAEFNFDKDYPTYLPFSNGKNDPFAMAFQACYTKTSLSNAGDNFAFLPLTVDYGNDLKMTILESDVESYPGMFVQSKGKSQKLKAVFAGLPSKTGEYSWRKQEYVMERSANIAKVKGTRSFPWRIFSITTCDTQMPVNNMVYALASPNKIGDFSWIKGGKSSWEWWNDWGISQVHFKAGINMDTYKHYIDFASENGIEFIILDEGWYTPSSGDMMQPIPELDLPQLIAYAKDRKVDIILWTVFNVLDKQLDEACLHYSKLGVKGFKVDFLDRNDQKAVEMVYRIAEKTAQHKLTLNLHGMYPPTGLNRTFPNIINFESVFGMEEMKWSSAEVDMPLYDVTFPFIRLAAGSVDYTPGAMRNASRKDFKDIYNNPMSQGTRCHQIATYIVYDSPLTMLCDNPTIYRKEQESTDFICSIPLQTDETKILKGRLGEFIVTARRHGNTWHVGALTNWDKRDITFELSFLKKGTLYKAEIFRDGINADKQASDYIREIIEVSNETILSIHLAAGGGFAIKLTELEKPSEIKKTTYFPQEIWNVSENNDYNDSTSQFSKHRMKETINLVAFWEAAFGNDPAKATLPKYRFELEDLMSDAEKMFLFYRDTLKFVKPAHSLTQKYRMNFYVYHNDDGTCYGGGAEEKIGAMWLSPGRIQKKPYGTIAHELGHAFQYMLSCDGYWAYSSAPEGSMIQPIYELTSQYMLFQYYPEWMQFEAYHVDNYLKNTHKPFLHESIMYSAPYVLEFWSEKYGKDFIGKLWKNAVKGEDPIMTYKRITDIDQTSLNNELMSAYMKFISWDMNRIKGYAKKFAHKHTTKLVASDDGWYKIDESNCPQNYGYNGIRLKVPEGNNEIKVNFKGLPGHDGYRAIHTDKAGWRYAFVAEQTNGEKLYGAINSESEAEVTYKVPQNTAYLWLVVMGAPTEHWEHLCDNNAENDEQWPYQIKLTNTELY